MRLSQVGGKIERATSTLTHLRSTRVLGATVRLLTPPTTSRGAVIRPTRAEPGTAAFGDVVEGGAARGKTCRAPVRRWSSPDAGLPGSGSSWWVGG